MPDTKSGRERNGRNKRRQLHERLFRQEIEAMDADADLPEFDEQDAERAELLADELPED
jgi:hypothetical protein